MVRPMTCPVCGKSVAATSEEGTSTAPFCSLRCKQIDFVRWSDGRYAIVEQLEPARLADAIRRETGVESDTEE